MIYLDNSATTQPAAEVLDVYLKVAKDYFGNPSSLHTLGMEAEALLQQARQRIAEQLGTAAKEIIFTSGGTEGNNLAIKGSAYALKARGKHLITTEAEHPSTFEVFRELERLGFEVTYLPVDTEGRISVAALEQAIRRDTTLVSIIHVNNETGTIQPINEIGERLAKYPHIRFHVDHVQGLIKYPLHFSNGNIDLCTMSGHKCHAPKGTGLLYVRNNLRLTPQLHGGEQESRLRAGTENVAGAVALAKALRLESEKAEGGMQKLRTMNDMLRAGLLNIPGISINSPADHSAVHIINFSIPKLKPEVLIQALAEYDIYVSTKSACSSKLSEPSRVLLAMGLAEELAGSAIRVSLSFQNTEDEVATLLKQLSHMLPELMKVMK